MLVLCQPKCRYLITYRYVDRWKEKWINRRCRRCRRRRRRRRRWSSSPFVIRHRRRIASKRRAFCLVRVAARREESQKDFRRCFFHRGDVRKLFNTISFIIFEVNLTFLNRYQAMKLEYHHFKKRHFLTTTSDRDLRRRPTRPPTTSSSFTTSFCIC